MVGFVSPQSLAGQARTPDRAPEPLPGDDEPDLFDPPAIRRNPPGPFDRTATTPVTPFAPLSGTSDTEGLRQTAPRQEQASRITGPAAPMSLFAVYILILLAVPTFGVSAVIGLLAVLGREGPKEPLAAGHFLYQKRTLLGGLAAALAGALLVVVNIGVVLLFLAAVWILARGVYGVLSLKSGRPVRQPRSWLF